MRNIRQVRIIFIVLFLLASAWFSSASEGHTATVDFPVPLDGYEDARGSSIIEIIRSRIVREPFNLAALLIFVLAIVHTFSSSWFLAKANTWQKEHNLKKMRGEVDRSSIHIGAGLFHFLGEVEVIFGIWAILLCMAIAVFHSWDVAIQYVGYSVDFTDPIFIVVIMTLASSRPVLKMFELLMWKIANALGGSLEAWLFTILTIGPLLGSLITEPAAITISAYLLVDKLFCLRLSDQLKYATAALLFVNTSVGGTLTHFAAPPVLMVARAWNWNLVFMISNFGWKAFLGILIANGVYFFIFKRELRSLKEAHIRQRFTKYIQKKFINRHELEDQFDKIENDVNQETGFTKHFSDVCESLKENLQDLIRTKLSPKDVTEYDAGQAIAQRFENIKHDEMKKTVPGLLPMNERPPYRDPNWDSREDWVPTWMMVCHVMFMIWVIINSHHTVLFISGFLFFLGFSQVTASYQNRINLKPALLVGFFLAGLLIHGGVQAWWIEPVLGNLKRIPLMFGATILTAFNDNASITYLSTLVRHFSPTLQYIVVAGAVTGGGLTVIANAPNPVGQSVLKKYFEHGISPLKLLRAAILPTLIIGACFLL